MMRKIIFFGAALAATVFTGCDSEDDIVNLTSVEKYPITLANSEDIIGKVLLRDLDNDGSRITIKIEDDTYDDMNYSATINQDNAVDGGGVVYSLNPIEDGKSVTTLDLSNDDSLTFEEFLDYDGHITILKEDGSVLGYADIGQNRLTDYNETYTLSEVDGSTIFGDATFYKRQNAETLVVLDVEGTPEDGTHPSHIHAGTVGSSGPIVVTFNPVDGSTGLSFTNVSTVDDGTLVSYSDLVNYDGYINVHTSPSDLSVVAAGNIGSNVD